MMNGTKYGGGFGKERAMNEYIYITEDEDNIRELLRCTVESFGYRVKAFETAEELLEAVQEERPALILLDIMLPGMDGLQALAVLRGTPATAGVRVIMLTAKSGEVDKVRGLDHGADDYITKPFGVLELSARIRAVLRRSADGSKGESTALRGMHVEMHTGDRAVYVDGRTVELTLKEYELLRILMERGCVVTREELLNAIWGYDYVGETRTLDMHIKTLRAKLGDSAEHPSYIKTVRGVGYQFIDRVPGKGQ